MFFYMLFYCAITAVLTFAVELPLHRDHKTNKVVTIKTVKLCQ